jgi:hypothetical protein
MGLLVAQGTSPLRLAVVIAFFLAVFSSRRAVRIAGRVAKRARGGASARCCLRAILPREYRRT